MFRGIDAIYVGPADLAFSLGKTPKLDAGISSSSACTRLCWRPAESAGSTRASITAIRRVMSSYSASLAYCLADASPSGCLRQPDRHRSRSRA